ncbi:MAG: hypothetical protein ACKV2T_13070 [Kofleriaceae bacterium]
MRTAMFAVVAIACGSSRSDPPAGSPTGAQTGSNAASQPVRKPPPGPIYTIRGQDYIGPDACGGECHPGQLAAWTTSLHRRMNQLAGPDSVIGDFGTRIVYAGGTATFAREGSPRAGDARYTMTLEKNGTTRRYRVTRTIGVRRLQEYVGVDVDDPNAVEVRLPFGWWPRAKGWFAQPYFDPWFAREEDFDAYAKITEPWAERCPWCHSTYPFEQRIARASVREVGHGMEQFFTPAAASVTPSERLAIDQQITTGISCESCHLGGRAHAAGAAISFVPQGALPRDGMQSPPRPRSFAEEKVDATIVNRVCAQCHSGPSPRLADGTALRNSSEAIDLAASSCTTARCTDCHDPHTGGSDEKRANAACVGCHAQLADAAAQSAHGGHTSAAGVTSATCLDCHMPKLVMGIDRVVRTHRISSPTNPAIIATGGINACNLCHVDRSLYWTLGELRERYDVTLRATDPDEADRPMGERWLASNEPAFRLLAADALARSTIAKLALPSLKKQLADPLPHVRAWARFAVDGVPLR